MLSGLGVFFMVNTAHSTPPEMVRGPYLQRATHSNILVRWRTSVPTDSQATFGLHPSTLTNIASDPTPVTNHIIQLEGLEPGTRYYYGIGTTNTLLASGAEYHFTTPPATQPPLRIWALGDVGTAGLGQPGPALVRDTYQAFTGNRPTDVWLLLGDNAYNTGTDAQYQLAIFDVFQDILRTTPPWSTIGNHEVFSYVPNGSFPWQDIFSPPTQGEAGGIPSGTPFYYSFNYGNVHFVCIDSEISGNEPGDDMMNWLEADLSANTKDWLIAFWHSPPYTKGSHNSDSTVDSGGNLFQMRTNVVPVLESHGVDLVLCGHSHDYERSYLVDGHYGTSDTLQPSMLLDAGTGRPAETGAYRKAGTGPAAHQGTVYVVAGSSGWATFTTGRHPIMCEQHLRVGSLIVDVDGPRLDGTFLTDTGDILDTFTILKNAPPAPLAIVEYQLNDGNARVTWKSVAGTLYQVDFSPNLIPPSWEPVSGDILATGATTMWTNSAANNAAEGYYRVSEVRD